MKGLYEEALRANMEKWAPYAAKLSKPFTVSNADVGKYLSSALGSYDFAGTDESLYAGKYDFLMSQKPL